MADINIERRRRYWPWILGLLALLLVVWVVVQAIDRDEQDAPRQAERAPVTGETVGAERGAEGAMREYFEFAGLTGTTPEAPEMGREHEYTAEGIRKLSQALEALVAQRDEAEVREGFERFREKADRIQQDPASPQHANVVADIFTSAADVIARVDGDQNAEGLREIARSIEPEQPLLEQKDEIQQFFRASAEAIRAASQRA